ncbi:conjugal transfer protein TraF [Helicobacter sp. MIT 21-1697]|uniref:conjugal transfer protein TraF n=1 Tax=Helicobacter sp. MIT 21-1697 TaxID=2993733 RepID=UPI00224A8D3C|nr:conjugal transfer protein TraF [Helicobacter sp. MIT 21-1697]MCX2717911.1 conjugal transfer protein TraF [Helicobacter sp. MIT 21-1697]
MWGKRFLALGMLSSCFYNSLEALEFGSMGNTSAAMGGAGVALKHSAWGLYYNPALLSSDPRVKMGYSLGIGLKEQNLAKLAKIDINNMADTAERLVSTFASNSGASVGEVTNVVENALKSVLGQSASGNVAQDLQTYLQNHQGGNYSDLITAVLTQVQGSTALNNEQKNLLSHIAGSIDYGTLDFSQAGGMGSVAAGLLQGITIAKGGDKGLDKAVNDISAVQDILKDNNLNVVSQDGVVLQISTKTMNEKLGSLGVALFASVYSSMSIKADASRMRLIIDGGNNSFYELVDNGDSFSYKPSNQKDYNSYSLIASLEDGSNAHKLIATSFVLTELPVGYARTFYLKNGNLNIGLAGKFMSAMSTQREMGIRTNMDFKKELTDFASLDGAISSNSFGIDVGALYEVDFPEFRYLTFGLVAKNINSPSFQSTFSDITIKPQYRAGIGYNTKRFNLAFDADLTPNDLIAFSNIKQQSQMIGGGVAFDFKAIDVRVGAMKDLRQDTGLILTGGLNVLGFLDIALQTSTKFTRVENIPIPQYLNIRVGGSLSF